MCQLILTRSLLGLAASMIITSATVCNIGNPDIVFTGITGKTKINIPIISLRKLSEYFGTSVDYILELTDELRPYPRRKQKSWSGEIILCIIEVCFYASRRLASGYRGGSSAKPRSDLVNIS